MARTLLEFFEAILIALENVARFLGDMINQIINTALHVMDYAFLPEVLVSLLISWLFCVVVIFMIAAVHLIRGRAANVFISYQHQHQLVAENLRSQLEEDRIDAELIEFDESAEHDDLLDSVQIGIRQCDVFVCIPGEEASFVENEVAMAFALQKPMLFLATNDEKARFPNTAKKGYPIFSLKQLKASGLSQLSYFCSYLAADRRSTLRLYTAIAEYLWSCLGLVAAAYLISAAMLSVASGSSPESIGIFPLTLFIALNSLLILLPFLYFTLNRNYVRRKIRDVVAGKKYTDEFLPRKLDDRLSKASLLTVVLSVGISAHHEAEPVKAELVDTEANDENLEHNRSSGQNNLCLSCNPEWQKVARDCYQTTRDEIPLIPCPLDLLPSDLSPDFNWFIHIPSESQAFLVTLADPDENNEPSEFESQLLVFVIWVPIILVVINSPLGLSAAGIGVAVLVFLSILVIIAIYQNRSDSKSVVRERPIVLSKEIRQMLKADDETRPRPA